MAKNNDPLIDSLMQMAVAAAPLIRKARESGLFRDRDTMVDAEIVPPKPPEAPAAPSAAPKAEAAPSPDISANYAGMQDIIVRQALRINELESEVAALKAAKAKSPAKAKARPAKSPKS